MSSTYHSNGASINGGESLRMQQEAHAPDDRSLGDIFKDLSNHTRELVKGEVALAKREMSENAKSLAVPIAMFAAAGVASFVGLLLLGHTLAWALNNIMDAGLAYLVSALIFMAVAGTVALIAKKKLDKAKVAPTDSIEEAKEDLTWIKSHAR
jgi:hypothetical protein